MEAILNRSPTSTHTDPSHYVIVIQDPNTQCLLTLLGQIETTQFKAFSTPGDCPARILILDRDNNLWSGIQTKRFGPENGFGLKLICSGDKIESIRFTRRFKSDAWGDEIKEMERTWEMAVTRVGDKKEPKKEDGNDAATSQKAKRIKRVKDEDDLGSRAGDVKEDPADVKKEDEERHNDSASVSDGWIDNVYKRTIIAELPVLQSKLSILGDKVSWSIETRKGAS